MATPPNAPRLGKRDILVNPRAKIAQDCALGECIETPFCKDFLLSHTSRSTDEPWQKIKAVGVIQVLMDSGFSDKCH